MKVETYVTHKTTQPIYTDILAPYVKLDLIAWADGDVTFMLHVPLPFKNPESTNIPYGDTIPIDGGKMC